jgi:hypothetical protein
MCIHVCVRYLAQPYYVLHVCVTCVCEKFLCSMCNMCCICVCVCVCGCKVCVYMCVCECVYIRVYKCVRVSAVSGAAILCVARVYNMSVLLCVLHLSVRVCVGVICVAFVYATLRIQ